MSKFHTLQVADVRKETADCVSISFDIPSHLQQEYNYIQGQYITLKVNINGEELRRSYSVCSSPHTDNELRVAIKKVKDGRCSTFVNDSLKAGDKLEVMTPMGNFNSPLHTQNKKNYVLFAGGSGITPMMSILKSVLHQEPQSSVVLIYGNQHEEAIIFRNELASIQSQFADRLKVVYVLEHSNESDASLHKGLITVEKTMALIEQYVGLNLDNEFFICGPTPMMKNVEEVLLNKLQIAKPRVHLEYFTAGGDATPKTVVADGAPAIESEVTIIMDGDETTITLSSNGPSILDAALDTDMDVPFACKGAVCCTCRAKVIEGEVRMDLNYALSEEEVAKGYILTCQSHPISAKVIVDYDS